MKHKGMLFVFILALPVLASCGGNKPKPTGSYTVNFDAGSGHFVDSPKTEFTVEGGTSLRTIEIPCATDDSSTYVGWATDINGNNSVTYDYKIESDITLYAQYSNVDLVVDNPIDNSIVCYGSTAIGYHLFDLDKTVVANSSNSSVLNVTVDSAHSAVIVDAANSNINNSANVSVGIKSSAINSSYNIGVHYPTSIQEAGESFDYALGRGIYNITLTFNYNNQDNLDTFFNNRMETRLIAPFIYEGYTWNTGVGKTNHVKLAPSDKMATKSKDISQSSYSQYYYKNLKNAAYELRHSKIQKRTGNHFAIDDAKKRLKVHNSETLFFALERGFRPEFDSNEISVSGSIAQRAYQVYQKAREACADAFGTETTDDLMKIRQLFEWLVDNTSYDHWIVSEDATEVENFWEWSSYFSEGVFLNEGIAVCDGFSKALAIMSGIEGLPVIRSAGFATYEDEEGDPITSGHAWNYYHHSNGQWYLICPTWAHKDNKAETDFINYNYSAISYQTFMTQSDYFYSYIYNVVYNACKDQGYTESEAKALAEEIAKESDYKEMLFTDITKSNKPLVSNIYKTDVFDKSRGYDFDLNSEAEATALGNALPTTLKSDFCIDLSYGSLDYLQSLAGVICNRLGAKEINASYDYSYSNCTIYVKFYN